MHRVRFVVATRVVVVLVLSIVACVEPSATALGAPGEPVPLTVHGVLGQPLLNPANGDLLVLTSHALDELAPDGSAVGELALNSPTGMTFLGDRLYVAEPAADAIAVVDYTSLTLVAELATGSGSCPTYLTSDGTRLWVGYGCSKGDVAPFDAAAPSPLPAAIRYSSAPEVAATSSVLLALTPAPASPTGEQQSLREVFDIDGSDLTSHTRSVGRRATAPQFTPDGTHAVVAGFPSSLLSIPDLSVVATYPGNRASPRAQLSPDGRHVAVSDLSDSAPRLIVYATDTGVAEHATFLPLISTPGGRAGAFQIGLAAFLADSTHLLALADYSGAVSGEYAVELPGWRSDPAALATTVTTTAASVGISGWLSFTDGTLPAVRPITVTRSGPLGTVVVGVALTDLDGSFELAEPTPPDGRYTYRAAWLGDLDHATALSLASINVGGVPPLPDPPPTDIVEPDRDIDLGLSSVAGTVIDDLHRRLLIAGDQVIQARDFEGNLLGIVALPGKAASIALSQDETTAFVTVAGLDAVAVIDTAVPAIVGTLPTGPVIGQPHSVVQVDDKLVYSALQRDVFGYLPLADPLASVMLPVALEVVNLVASHDHPSMFVAYSADEDPAILRVLGLPGGVLTSEGGWAPQYTTNPTVGAPVDGVPALSDDAQHVLAKEPDDLVDLDVSELNTPPVGAAVPETRYNTGAYAIGGAYTHDSKFVFTATQSVADWKEEIQLRPAGGPPDAVLRVFGNAPVSDRLSIPYITRDESRLFWTTSSYTPAYASLHLAHMPTWPAPCLSVAANQDASTPDVDVSGTVRGSDGRGVPNASVTIDQTAPDGMTRHDTATTSDDGTFRFVEPPAAPGSYRYAITAAPTSTLTCTATATADVSARASASPTPSTTPSVSPTPSTTPSAATPADETALTLGAVSAVAVAGTTDELVGSLVDATTSTPIPNVDVRLLGRPHGQQQWTSVATLVPDSAGQLRFPVTATYNYDYELTVGGDAVHAPATSDVTSVLVPTRIGRSASATLAKRGRTISFLATLWPVGPYAPVLQRYDSGGWHRVSAGISLGHGKYVVKLTFRTPGRFIYRYVVHATNRNTAGFSRPITVHIV